MLQLDSSLAPACPKPWTFRPLAAVVPHCRAARTRGFPLLCVPLLSVMAFTSPVFADSPCHCGVLPVGCRLPCEGSGGP